MDELDILLSVIENPTRRKILEALVREPHYPLQLSKELGMSQQIVMKHLKVLEDSQMVRSYPEESDQGGPKRKRYVPTGGFTIIVDVGQGLFSVESSRHGIDEADHRHERGSGEEIGDLTERVMGLRLKLKGLDTQLEELSRKRVDLIEEKERVLDEAARLVEGAPMDYRQRHLVFEYVQHPELDLEELADLLGLREDLVKEILRPISKGV